MEQEHILEILRAMMIAVLVDLKWLSVINVRSRYERESKGAEHE